MYIYIYIRIQRIESHISGNINIIFIPITVRMFETRLNLVSRNHYRKDVIAYRRVSRDLLRLPNFSSTILNINLISNIRFSANVYSRTIEY